MLDLSNVHKPLEVWFQLPVKIPAHNAYIMLM